MRTDRRAYFGIALNIYLFEVVLCFRVLLEIVSEGIGRLVKKVSKCNMYTTKVCAQLWSQLSLDLCSPCQRLFGEPSDGPSTLPCGGSRCLLVRFPRYREKHTRAREIAPTYDGVCFQAKILVFPR